MTQPGAVYFSLPATGSLWQEHADGGVPCILWDKDSTLADTLHRQPMIEKIKAGEATWTDYSLACTGDGVIAANLALMNLLTDHARWFQFIVSGANAEAEPQIRDWAARYQVPYDALILRRASNHEPNATFKCRVIRELRTFGYKPILFVEDWAECGAQITRATGVPAVIVSPGYPPDVKQDGAGA